jgi:hypothetical protein
MSTKTPVLSKKNIHLYSDATQDLICIDEKEKSIFLEIYNPKNFSFVICHEGKNNYKMTVEINCKDFENVCKEYLNHIKEKSFHEYHNT